MLQFSSNWLFLCFSVLAKSVVAQLLTLSRLSWDPQGGMEIFWDLLLTAIWVPTMTPVVLIPTIILLIRLKRLIILLILLLKSSPNNHCDSRGTLSARGFSFSGNLCFKLFLWNWFISLMAFPKKAKPSVSEDTNSFSLILLHFAHFIQDFVTSLC